MIEKNFKIIFIISGAITMLFFVVFGVVLLQMEELVWGCLLFLLSFIIYLLLITIFIPQSEEKTSSKDNM